MIDVHVHVTPPRAPGVGNLHTVLEEPPERVARALAEEMAAAGVTRAYAMGCFSDAPDDPLGVKSTLAVAARMGPAVSLGAIGVADPTRTDKDHFRRAEAHLRSGHVKAFKAYLGYVHFAPADDGYRPYYELAERYKVPFFFHTGDTYSRVAKLKFAHPLGVDEVAVDHPRVRFVVCHVGNPWMTDAAEVVYKNENVWADLSGLVVGDAHAFGADALADVRANVAKAFRYAERPDRFLFGTDWPLAPLAEYAAFVAAAVPKEHHAAMFEGNARLLFGA